MVVAYKLRQILLAVVIWTEVSSHVRPLFDTLGNGQSMVSSICSPLFRCDYASRGALPQWSHNKKLSFFFSNVYWQANCDHMQPRCRGLKRKYGTHSNTKTLRVSKRDWAHHRNFWSLLLHAKRGFGKETLLRQKRPRYDLPAEESGCKIKHKFLLFSFLNGDVREKEGREDEGAHWQSGQRIYVPALEAISKFELASLVSLPCLKQWLHCSAALHTGTRQRGDSSSSDWGGEQWFGVNEVGDWRVLLTKASAQSHVKGGMHALTDKCHSARVTFFRYILMLPLLRCSECCFDSVSLPPFLCFWFVCIQQP